MRNLIVILFLFVSINLFGQGIRCPVCPPSLDGVTDGWVLTDSSGLPVWQVSGGGGAGSFWKTTGNSGTTTSNFIGTTDVAKVRFRYANIPSGFVDGFNTAYGLHSLLMVDTSAGGTGISNTSIGISALHFNTTGTKNTATGESALRLNTTGTNNTANGFFALRNSIGGGNIAIGAFAGQRGSHTNKFFVSNQDFGATADSLNKQIRNSLMYGSMGGDSSTNSLRINAAVQISDGTQSNGDVFTCDANGVGSWQAAGANAWSLTGNAGTDGDGLTQYCGTTDAKAFFLKGNNGAYGQIILDVGQTRILNDNIQLLSNNGLTQMADFDVVSSTTTILTTNLIALLNTPAVGDVLTATDVAGTAQWQAPAVVSFENGLDLTSGIGKLGSNLTEPTTLLELDGTNQLFAVIDTSGANMVFGIGDVYENGRIAMGAIMDVVSMTADSIILNGNVVTTKGINTTAGDAATINTTAGRFRKDATGAVFTLTNNLVTANSIVSLTAANAAIDATATGWTKICSANTITVTFNAAPTANFDMDFLVTN